MSLYEGIEGAQGATNEEYEEGGCIEGLKFMQTQLKLKRTFKSKMLGAAKMLHVAPSESSPALPTSNPMYALSLCINAYDPTQPNEYAVWVTKFVSNSEPGDVQPVLDDDKEDSCSREASKDISGVSVPPPSHIGSVLESKTSSTSKNDISILKRAPTSGLGDSFGHAMLAKYGWKEGQGLGKNQQGISVALNVEKIGRHGGKIVDRHSAIKKYLSKLQRTAPTQEEDDPDVAASSVQSGPADISQRTLPPSLSSSASPTSTVLLLLNMVSEGEADNELETDVTQECAKKYGPVAEVLVHEVLRAGGIEEIGVFVRFEDKADAAKALADLNTRFFGGRNIEATYFDETKFQLRDFSL